MAEFLIKAVNATNPDPTKDERGCYKRGDIVDVRPDGFAWGLEERLPRFVQVQVTGVSVAAALAYIAPSTDPNQLDRDGHPIRIRRRLYRVLVDTLPLAVRQQLSTTGRYVTTWTAIRNFVQNSRTGATGG